MTERGKPIAEEVVLRTLRDFPGEWLRLDERAGMQLVARRLAWMDGHGDNRRFALRQPGIAAPPRVPIGTP